MNSRLTIGLAALLCGLLASCYPYEEHAQRTKPKKAPQTKTEEQVKPKPETTATEQPKTGSESTAAINPAPPTLNVPVLPSKSTTTTPKPATSPTKPEYPYANKVPGKDGFVFSPYNQKVVDVRDIPSGTLVQDPTYPPADKKYFRVP
jgi:hypothetical protein